MVQNTHTALKLLFKFYNNGPLFILCSYRGNSISIFSENIYLEGSK